MRRRYVDTRAGQIHVRDFQPTGTAVRPDLLCLHPMPYSGVFYQTVAPLLAEHCRVICPDYPGYGNSDALSEAPSIEGWAETMLEALAQLDVSNQIDILGFHTGCLVGPEMALQASSKVRRLVLVDVPFFDPDGRQSMLAKIPVPPAYDEHLESISDAWRMNVSLRVGKIPHDRCMELLAEQLRTGSRGNDGFRAAFSYHCDQRFAEVRTPCLVIATDSGLHEPSIAAYKTLPNAQLKSDRTIESPAFEIASETLAEHVSNYLSD